MYVGKGGNIWLRFKIRLKIKSEHVGTYATEYKIGLGFLRKEF
jgi:hypothetical protein